MPLSHGPGSPTLREPSSSLGRAALEGDVLRNLRSRLEGPVDVARLGAATRRPGYLLQVTGDKLLPALKQDIILNTSLRETVPSHVPVAY